MKSDGPVDSRVEERHQRQRHDEIGDDDVAHEKNVDTSRRVVEFVLRGCTRAERWNNPRLGVTAVNTEGYSRQGRKEPQQERQRPV